MERIVLSKYPSESDSQIAFLQWWREQKYPLIWHTPNGGSRGAREAARLKREGVIPGVPDLFCPELRLFIEFKREDGRLSADQKELLAYLESVGYECIVVYGLADAKEQMTVRRKLIGE